MGCEPLAEDVALSEVIDKVGRDENGDLASSLSECFPLAQEPLIHGTYWPDFSDADRLSKFGKYGKLLSSQISILKEEDNSLSSIWGASIADDIDWNTLEGPMVKYDTEGGLSYPDYRAHRVFVRFDLTELDPTKTLESACLYVTLLRGVPSDTYYYWEDLGYTPDQWYASTDVSNEMFIVKTTGFTGTPAPFYTGDWGKVTSNAVFYNTEIVQSGPDGDGYYTYTLKAYASAEDLIYLKSMFGSHLTLAFRSYPDYYGASYVLESSKTTYGLRFPSPGDGSGDVISTSICSLNLDIL